MPKLLDAATTTGAGEWIPINGKVEGFEIFSDSSHSGTSKVDIQVTNDKSISPGFPIGTLIVTGADDCIGFPANVEGWDYVRANCTQHGDSTNGITVLF